jgi:hypothetical protein
MNSDYLLYIKVDVFWVGTLLPPSPLHPEDEGSKVLQNIHHYTVSQPEDTGGETLCNNAILPYHYMGLQSSRI